MCLIPGKIGINPKTGKEMTGPYAEFIKNAPPLKSSDYYFEELRKIQEEQKKKNNGDDQIEVSIGEGMGTLDDHDQWENLPKEVQDAIRDKVHEMLEQAVKKADRNNDWGSVPHEIQQAIRHILSREIDWRSIVRNFFGRCRTMERISTVRRINKKKPYVFPGVKRKLVANFAVFIDQSGSMSDEDISMLFSELETFAQLTSLDVYHFDTEIDEKSHTVWKKGKAFPKPYRTRCGGTDFQAVADFCNKSENRGKWAGVVILTDGYAPKMGQIVGSKTMWVITEGGTMDTVGENDLCVQMKKDRVFKKRF
jgi:predicted metal-dependent peptidase